MFVNRTIGPAFAELRPMKAAVAPAFPVYKDLADRLAAVTSHPDELPAHVMAVCGGYAYSDAETLSMMVATVPIIAPIMFKAGYDPVWFGIIIIILMELAMITPPVGSNLYVVQGLRKRGRIDDVIIGASPFVITMLLMLVILSIWPQLALWLPQLAAN